MEGLFAGHVQNGVMVHRDGGRITISAINDGRNTTGTTQAAARTFPHVRAQFRRNLELFRHDDFSDVRGLKDRPHATMLPEPAGQYNGNRSVKEEPQGSA
jgi:hypothetical protein